MLRAARTRLGSDRDAGRPDVAGVRGCLFGLAVAAAFWLVVAVVLVITLR